MVNYAEWNKAVHQAFKEQGGTYNSDEVATELTQLAAEFWQENKEEIKQLAFDAAVKLAIRALSL